MAKQLCYRKLLSKEHPKSNCSSMLSCHFEADGENIVPVTYIDSGVFHNFIHMCKQHVLCDAIRSRYSLLTPLSQAPHLLIREYKKKERSDKKRKDYCTVYEPSLE